MEVTKGIARDEPTKIQRHRAPRPRLLQPDPETFHLSVMMGAGGIAGGMAGICSTLKGWTKGGGYVLVGEGYWRQKPPADYLALLGGPESQFLDHRGNVQAGVDAGLIPMHATT